MDARVGDRGQRYKVVAFDGNGEEFGVGWTDDPNGGSLVKMVRKHPVWHSPKVIDREALKKQDHE